MFLLAAVSLIVSTNYISCLHRLVSEMSCSISTEILISVPHTNATIITSFNYDRMIGECRGRRVNVNY